MVDAEQDEIVVVEGSGPRGPSVKVPASSEHPGQPASADVSLAANSSGATSAQSEPRKVLLEDAYAATVKEAKEAPNAFSLAQLLAIGTFDGIVPSEVHSNFWHLAVASMRRIKSGTALLLGTSLCIEDAAVSSRGVHVVSREACRVPGEEEVLETSNSVDHETDPLLPHHNRSNKRATAGGNLQGVLSDVEKMRKYFLRVTAAAKKRHKYVSYDVFEVWNQRRNEGKKDMVKTIKRFFAQKYKEDAPQLFVIYYSGHGTQDGDWAIGRTKRFRRKTAVDVLTVEELISLWHSEPCWFSGFTKSHLIIVADSCHSGKWVEKINSLGRNSCITMIAACGANETCTDTPNGGDFTANLLREPGAESISFHPAYTQDIEQAGCHLALIMSFSQLDRLGGGGISWLSLLLCCLCWPYFLLSERSRSNH